MLLVTFFGKSFLISNKGSKLIWFLYCSIFLGRFAVTPYMAYFIGKQFVEASNSGWISAIACIAATYHLNDKEGKSKKIFGIMPDFWYEKNLHQFIQLAVIILYLM